MRRSTVRPAELAEARFTSANTGNTPAGVPDSKFEAGNLSMKYATICSGIEAPSVAWKGLGWKPVFFSEIEAFPCSLLKHHYPNVPNYGDMNGYKKWPDSGTIDLICAGTPCQAFSIAGLRKGLDDPRGNLTLVFLGILRRYCPEWVVWENVPGVLSEKTGAFGAFLGGLGELGYGFAYRILDAQYCGVPQRRRRVFVVGCLGSWQRAAAVLFERHSLQGYPPPRKEAGKSIAADIAPSLTNSGRGVERVGESRGQDPVVAHTLKGEGFDASEDGTGRGTPLVVGALACNSGPNSHDSGKLHCNQAVDAGYIIPDTAGCLQERDAKGVDSDTKPGHLIPIAFSCKDNGADAGEVSPTLRSGNHAGSHANGGVMLAIAFKAGQSANARSLGLAEEISPTLPSSDSGSNRTPTVCHTTGAGFWQKGAGTLRGRPQDSHENLVTSMQVRRLTPKECERLQGFPDNYTNIIYRGKPAADGPRYKALGNSMAVPVVKWIGERIQEVLDL